MSADDTLIMYIVMRSDLDFSKGALISNGAHAATAVIAENLDDEVFAADCECILTHQLSQHQEVSQHRCTSRSTHPDAQNYLGDHRGAASPRF